MSKSSNHHEQVSLYPFQTWSTCLLTFSVSLRPKILRKWQLKKLKTENWQKDPEPHSGFLLKITKSSKMDSFLAHPVWYSYQTHAWFINTISVANRLIYSQHFTVYALARWIIQTLHFPFAGEIIFSKTQPYLPPDVIFGPEDDEFFPNIEELEVSNAAVLYINTIKFESEQSSHKSEQSYQLQLSQWSNIQLMLAKLKRDHNYTSNIAYVHFIIDWSEQMKSTPSPQVL